MRTPAKALGIGTFVTVTTCLSVQTAEETFQASVEVLEPIVISSSTTLSFGKIIPSNNGSPNDVSSTGLQPSGAGNGSYVSGSGATSTVITIDGTDGEFITYSLTPGACTDATNLSLALSQSGGNFQADIAFTLNGTLTVQSGSPAGAYTCDYAVTANYT